MFIIIVEALASAGIYSVLCADSLEMGLRMDLAVSQVNQSLKKR